MTTSASEVARAVSTFVEAALKNPTYTHAEIAASAGAAAFNAMEESVPKSEDLIEEVSKAPVVQDRLYDKPSTMNHGDLYTVRLYTDESIDGHVYTYVKHLWYKNQGKTLCICHFYEDGTYRFVMWQMEQVIWMQMTPQRFEQGRIPGT